MSRAKTEEEVREELLEQMRSIDELCTNMAGKTVKELEYDHVHGYWIMTFEGSGKMYFRLMADLAVENALVSSGYEKVTTQWND